MNTAYLLTGSNQGDRLEQLARARAWIERDCGIVRDQSALYETDPWGKTDQPAFLNQALVLETALPAAALMHRLLDIERKMGRERSERYGPRLIDIDILLFNDEIHLEADLKIPHPELPGRRFALLPLASVAARMLHPLTGKTIEALLSDCTDPGEVRAYP